MLNRDIVLIGSTPCPVLSLRGLLAVFDLAQILNLLWISFKTQYVYALIESYTAN